MWQLEIPPVGANSSRSLDAAAFVSDGGSPPARRCVWSGPYGEEFAPDTSASALLPDGAELLTVLVSGTLRRNVLGAIASEKNDCNFPKRSDDNRDESRKEPTASTQSSLRPTNRKSTRRTPGATEARKPRGEPFPLDKLFQERSDTPRAIRLSALRASG